MSVRGKYYWTRTGSYYCQTHCTRIGIQLALPSLKDFVKSIQIKSFMFALFDKLLQRNEKYMTRFVTLFLKSVIFAIQMFNQH